MEHLVYAGLAFLYGILFLIIITSCCCCLFVKNKRDCLQRMIDIQHSEITTQHQPHDRPASVEGHLYDVLEMDNVGQEPELFDVNGHIYEDIS